VLTLPPGLSAASRMVILQKPERESSAAANRPETPPKIFKFIKQRIF